MPTSLDEATVDAHIARVREAEQRIQALMKQINESGATKELLEKLDAAIAGHVAVRTELSDPALV